MPMPFGLPPPDPAIELFVASHGMTQGLSQSDGPQIIPRAYLRFGDVQVGAFWRNIDSPVATGIGVLFGRANIKRRSAQLDVMVLYRTRTGAHRPTDLHAWEVDATLRRSFGRFGVRLNAEYAPKEFELGHSLFIGVNARAVLPARRERLQSRRPHLTLRGQLLDPLDVHGTPDAP